MATDSEFADYLTMESFFAAEPMAQQNFATPQPNGDYMMAPLEASGGFHSYDQHANGLPNGTDHETQGKFEFHNNNNVQYFYDSNNTVQQQILQQNTQPPPEFYVSSLKY